MTIKEEKRDLFKVEEDYYLAHCISADLGMGAGIAAQFNRHFNMKKRLKIMYPQGVCDYYGWINTAVKVDRVFNLIAKERYWHKPTLGTLETALTSMKDQLIKDNGSSGRIKLAMPLIGCGLDGLVWSDVKPVIAKVFEDVDIEILICYISEELIAK